MTHQQIEKAAREYADGLADGLYYGDSPITRARLHAFRKGAEYALSHQWISVDDENDVLLTHSISISNF